MTSHPLARRAVVAAAALVVTLLAAPSAALGLARGPLDGPKSAGGRQRRQPLAGELHHAHQPDLLSGKRRARPGLDATFRAGWLHQGRAGRGQWPAAAWCSPPR
jgi:hypothetical protein